MYSCRTECPTIPQKTIPLATPIETVLAQGKEENCGGRDKDNDHRERGKGGGVVLSGVGTVGKGFQ